MNFTEYQQKLLDTKPRFLTDEEKKIREKCKNKIKYNKNKEQKKEYSKQYYKTPVGKKNSSKNNWKNRGLNMENFEQIYKRYCKTINCDNCGVLLTNHRKNNTFKCMDHDHSTGEFRNILCNSCNVRRG